MSKVGTVIRRFLTVERSQFPRFEGAVRLLPMPQLSPHMVSGKLLKWHCKEGEMIPAYGLIADVRPDQLMEEKDANHTDMELELQEDMYIARYLCNEGQEMKGGAPLAILCELEEDINEAKILKVQTNILILLVFCIFVYLFYDVFCIKLITSTSLYSI